MTSQMRASNGDRSGVGDIAVAGAATLAAGAGIYGATQANQAGPFIAGVVAIIVALVTWYATDRRQARALEAERARYEQQRSHEREMADLAEFRAVVDDAAARVWMLVKAYADLWEIIMPRTRPEVPGERVASLDKRMKTKIRESRPTVIEVNHDLARLTVRVGRAHPLVQALSEFRDGLLDGFREVQDQHQDWFANEGRRAFKERGSGINAARSRFLEEALKTVGSVLPRL